MKSYIFVLFTVLFHSALATYYSYSSTFYGCPDECETQEDPKCEISIPRNNLFIAMHPNYFKEKENGNFKYCEKYAIVMPLNYEKAVGSYKIVKGKVIDQCGSCGETQIDLSQTLFEKLAKRSTGVLEIVWSIISKEGKVYVSNKYDSDDLSELSKITGVSKSTIIESYNKVAKYMATHDVDLIREWPWEYLKNLEDDHDDDDDDDDDEKPTTRKTTASPTKKSTTTTTTSRTTTIRTTTTTTRKPTTTTTTKQPTKPVITSTKRPTTTTTQKPITTTTSKQPTRSVITSTKRPTTVHHITKTTTIVPIETVSKDDIDDMADQESYVFNALKDKKEDEVVKTTQRKSSLTTTEKIRSTTIAHTTTAHVTTPIAAAEPSSHQQQEENISIDDASAPNSEPTLANIANTFDATNQNEMVDSKDRSVPQDNANDANVNANAKTEANANTANNKANNDKTTTNKNVNAAVGTGNEENSKAIPVIFGGFVAAGVGILAFVKRSQVTDITNRVASGVTRTLSRRRTQRRTNRQNI